jgi:hypothetical protein
VVSGTRIDHPLAFAGVKARAWLADIAGRPASSIRSGYRP